MRALRTLRRRRVWPAYGLAVLLGVLASAFQAQAGWLLLCVLVISVGAFDLSISARIYALRRQVPEAVMMWFVIVVSVLGVGVLLFGWWQMLTGRR